MAILDTSYYKGFDTYSDGDETENFLLEIARNNKTIYDLKTEEVTWPILYHLSPLRENICNWYDFSGTSVLEVGAGCGAITGTLCKQAKEVYSVDLSARRCEINFERHKNCSNLHIYEGNLNDIVFTKPFDYVLLIGILEYAGRFTESETPYQTFLENIKNHLKPNGKVLIAIENRFGLKYFSGAEEDHLGKPFAGIRGYTKNDGVKTFSQVELKNILTKIGLNYIRFYYPYPDYKFPVEIFTDETIKSMNYGKPFQFYDKNRWTLFSEKDVAFDLIRENEVTSLANSFLIEASENDFLQDTYSVYAKLDNDRKPEFRVGTQIIKNDTEQFVRKFPLHEEAFYHINNISENEKTICKYRNVVLGEICENTIKYPFVKHRTLEADLMDAIKNKNSDHIIEIFDMVRNLAQVNSCENEYYSQEFKNWFGNAKLKSSNEICVSPGNIDLTLDNIFIGNGKLIINDCEWITKFPVPMDFIVWRFVEITYQRIGILNEILPKEVIFTRYKIKKERIEIYRKWAYYFENKYVSENNCSRFGKSIEISNFIPDVSKQLIVQIENQKKTITEQTAWIEHQDAVIREQTNKIIIFEGKTEKLNKKIESVEANNRHITDALYEITGQYNAIKNAFFWKITQPIRSMIDNFFSKPNAYIHRLLGKNNINLYTNDSCKDETESIPQFYVPGDPITILCTKHTFFVAKLIENALLQIKVFTKILMDEPEIYGEEVYIIICPQMFKRTPGRYIPFQMEQTISSRWLTPEYYDRLNHGYSILDYSLVNINFFKNVTEFGKNFYYLPLDYLPGFQSKSGNYEYDVLFYGDVNNERRKRYLEEIQKYYSVKIVTDVFGEDLYDLISKARIVINIHYYEDALLETTRIYEILSLGRSIVISEQSNDPEEEKRLEGVIDFVPVNNINAMIERIDFWLSHEDKRIKAVENNNSVLSTRANAFNFFFYRFLLANDWIDFDRFYQLAGNYIHFRNNRICLSLPESYERRKAFEKDNHYGFEIIPGLRHTRGWTGCGLSYKYIMKKAQEQKLKDIMICEDDVLFPPNFRSRLDKCIKYLSTNDQWDIFQGLMSDIGNVTIKKVVHQYGQVFVYLDHMISTVFNYYKSNVYQNLIDWDEKNPDVNSNTIDRALEAMNLNIITTTPFLVGHKEDLYSEIWDIQNTQYIDLISKSSEKLENLVIEYENK
ncbi:MAG: methyltransferase [Anaerolineaceae bacterium]|nr:methyltransferase [Anaerolineaceae bacterium]